LNAEYACSMRAFVFVMQPPMALASFSVFVSHHL
jgi:hypothetical protein